MVSSFRQPYELLLSDLKSIDGESGWKPGIDATRYYEDPRGRIEGKGALVLMPEDTRQVSEIVKLCNKSKVGIVPFNGSKGLVAAQISIEGDNAKLLFIKQFKAALDPNNFMGPGAIMARINQPCPAQTELPSRCLPAIHTFLRSHKIGCLRRRSCELRH